MSAQIRQTFSASERRAYRKEQNHQTLLYGRAFGWLVATSCWAFLYQDLVLLNLGMWALVWRLLPIIASTTFLVISYRRPPGQFTTVNRWHVLQQTALMIAACGIVVCIALSPTAKPDYLYGAIDGLDVCVIATGVLAGGARRHTPFVLGAPVIGLPVVMIASSAMQLKDMAMFTNSMAILAVAVAFSMVLERLSQREFSARMLAEARQDELETFTTHLIKMNHDQATFANIVSHDLQQPLCTVNWRLQLAISQLRKRGALTGTLEQHLGNAGKTVVNMQQLIARLLSYSKIEKRPFYIERLDLVKLVQEIRRDLAQVIKETGTRITVELLPWTMVDRTLFIQLFMNLIDNAIKYADPKRTPEIHISSKREEHCHRVSIRDNGRGVDPQVTRDIFAARVRLQEDDSVKGTGLGLATCRKIVEQHGGEIGFTREAPGTTFWFTVPRDPSDDTAAQGA